MKSTFGSLSLAVACVFFGASCETPVTQSATDFSQATLVSDTARPHGGATRPAREDAGMPEGIARTGGQYYYVRQGQATLLTEPQRFVQGVTYDGGQRIILADGQRVRLTDGDMVTFTGDRLPMPPGIRIP